MVWVLEMKTQDQTMGYSEYKRRTQRSLLLMCVLPVVYCGIYFILSVNGKYEPDIVGAGGVKSYVWAPAWFYDADHAWRSSVAATVAANQGKTIVYGGWNRFMGTIFYPLWQIDARYIHKPQ